MYTFIQAYTYTRGSRIDTQQKLSPSTLAKSFFDQIELLKGQLIHKMSFWFLQFLPKNEKTIRPELS